MSKFKIGDKVVVVKSMFDNPVIPAEILDVYDDNSYKIITEKGEWFYARDWQLEDELTYNSPLYKALE